VVKNDNGFIMTQWAEKGLDIVRLAEDKNGCRRFVLGVAYAPLPGMANHDAGLRCSGGNSRLHLAISEL